jgi:hypothetical protein
MIHAKLQKIDMIAECLCVSEIGFKCLFSQNEADIPRRSQKSLL